MRIDYWQAHLLTIHADPRLEDKMRECGKHCFQVVNSLSVSNGSNYLPVRLPHEQSIIRRHSWSPWFSLCEVWEPCSWALIQFSQTVSPQAGVQESEKTSAPLAGAQNDLRLRGWAIKSNQPFTGERKSDDEERNVENGKRRGALKKNVSHKFSCD